MLCCACGPVERSLYSRVCQRTAAGRSVVGGGGGEGEWSRDSSFLFCFSRRRGVYGRGGYRCAPNGKRAAGLGCVAFAGGPRNSGEG